MKRQHHNLIIGIFAAILVAGIIIFAIEKKKSFLQILVGFFLFVGAFAFISSFNSKVGSFILALMVLITTYIVIRNSYNDFWFGVLLALIIGGSAYYFRVRDFKPFSPSEYKKIANDNPKKDK